MSILDKLESTIKAVLQPKNTASTVPAIRQKILKIYEETTDSKSHYYWTGASKMKTSDTYLAIKAEKPKEKVQTLFEVLQYHIYLKKRSKLKSKEERELFTVTDNLLGLMLRLKMEFEENELIHLFEILLNPVGGNYYSNLPVGVAFMQVEKHVKKNGLSELLKEYLIKLAKHPKMDNDRYYGSDYKKIKLKITKILGEHSADGFVPTFKLSEKDDLGALINADIQKQAEEVQKNWYSLFQLAVMVNGGKPTKKYLAAVKPYVKALGTKFKPQMWKWLEFFSTLKEKEQLHTYEHGGHTHTYSSFTFLEEKNANLLKGLIWSLINFHDKKTLALLARATERAFKKIPGVGPAAGAIGNASIFILAQSKGLVGVSHLSRLKLKIRQNNTKKMIAKYVAEQSAKLGISPAEIEDLAIPDFDLVNGKKVLTFKDYQFEIEIIAIGKVIAKWIKPDGNVQKSVPAFVKQTKKYKDKLKAAKAEVKLIQKYLTAQRDRVDRNYIQNRKWNYPIFKEQYLEHGLMGFITKGLIWNLVIDGQNIPAVFRDNNWQTIDNKQIGGEAVIEQVTLWHPVEATTDEVIAWRDQLVTWQIKQPFKQAYREVYILTDAEVNTRLYSNRMAAHILKQHQFNALAGLRGWKYALMGWYDDGRDNETAVINIPEYGLSAEFWIGSLDEDEAFNDAGIWHYITTDQVRFKNATDTLNLVDVPKLIFSEIMRDVDMFVGVASVGNDPQWQDNGGLRQHHTYWQSYSFGDLSEMAKTRKAVLEKLIPRLKIRDKAEIDGKFLKIKGKIRDYKIHIGSTNILMEPNDQYLCIVPSRKKDTKTEGLFLPFEGDRGLSVVLSKAFMLVNDDKITDETITSQINR